MQIWVSKTSVNRAGATGTSSTERVSSSPNQKFFELILISKIRGLPIVSQLVLEYQQTYDRQTAGAFKLKLAAKTFDLDY